MPLGVRERTCFLLQIARRQTRNHLKPSASAGGFFASQDSAQTVERNCSMPTRAFLLANLRVFSK